MKQQADMWMPYHEYIFEKQWYAMREAGVRPARISVLLNHPFVSMPLKLSGFGARYSF